MTAPVERTFRVVQYVELGAAASVVWQVVGGFYNIHTWHPDIAKTDVPANQTSTTPLRRELTFPGQPITTEELQTQDNTAWYYKYKWHAGAWGERVKNYHAELRVVELEPDRRCLVQWSSTFNYTEDAVSEFYWNGFRELQKRFPLPNPKGATMGTFIELNDTLQLTTAQGFPADVFEFEKHQKKPITLQDVQGRLFTFQDKPAARMYQLDPVRVYFVHNINNKWLFWGHAQIQSIDIKKKLAPNGSWDGQSWLTSGTYLVDKVYDPEYQRLFTTTEAPVDRNFFK